jgi:O-methyltransferase
MLEETGRYKTQNKKIRVTGKLNLSPELKKYKLAQYPEQKRRRAIILQTKIFRGMIAKVMHIGKKKDWKGYKLVRKAWVLPLFTFKPLFAWKKYPQDFYRAFEIDQNELCRNEALMDKFLELKYSNSPPKVLMSLREMFNVYNLVDKVKDREGDMAEVGVYQGGSARIIAEAKGNKPLHLFDTFEGLPDPDARYDKKMVKGDMQNTSLDLVRKNLDPYDNIFYYQGLFPETAEPIRNRKFTFVNNDTDIYSSTKSVLEFFYPKMTKGGIMLTHDYNDSRTPGVRKAYDEFFADKPEQIIEIWDTQAYIVKT